MALGERHNRQPSEKVLFSEFLFSASHYAQNKLHNILHNSVLMRYKMHIHSLSKVSC